MKRVSVFLIAALALAMFAPAAPRAAAQSGNLLRNGGFETGGGGSGSADWLPWWAEIAKPADGSFNYAFRPSWNQESLSGGAAAAFVYAGNASQRVINNWDPWWAGVKQVVDAPAGARVRFTVYGRLWAAGGFWPTPSDPSAGGRITVGIDPNGSDNQFGAGVVWSGGISPHDTWQAVSVEATVGAGGKVGVFISADYRGSSRAFLAAVFDEASLTVVGSGPAPTSPPASGPQPTARPPQPVATRVPFVLPTPGPDGNIVYTVQAGDTGWSIAAQAGITLDQLRQLNPNVDVSRIFVGQKLVIGQAAPSNPPTSTPAPQPTVDPNAPTATTEAPTAAPNQPTAVAATGGELCVVLFEDVNGNGVQDANEMPLPGGLLTVLDATTGAPVQSYTTQPGEVVHCFQNIPGGRYTVAAAPPAGYNPTTANTTGAIEVQPGLRADIPFGAQRSGNAPGPGAVATGDDGRIRTALFGAAGIMLILLAAGLGAFLFLRRR
jgi:hypothetical protein